MDALLAWQAWGSSSASIMSILQWQPTATGPSRGTRPTHSSRAPRRLPEGVVPVLARQAVQMGLVALEAEHVPAGELAHERGVLAGAQTRGAGGDAGSAA